MGQSNPSFLSSLGLHQSQDDVESGAANLKKRHQQRLTFFEENSFDFLGCQTIYTTH